MDAFFSWDIGATQQLMKRFANVPWRILKKNPNPDTFECWERRCACIHIYFKGSSSCSLAELVLEASEKQGTFPVIIAKHRWNDRPGNCCRVSCWSHPPVCFIYWNAWELFHRWPSQAEQESLFGLGDVVPLGIGSNRKGRCWVTQQNNHQRLFYHLQRSLLLFNTWSSIPQALTQSPVSRGFV